MDLDALLDAKFMGSNGPIAKRLSRKGNRTTSEVVLEEVKLEVEELDPEIDPESPEFRTAVVLMAAAFMVGPHVDLLVQFTGYSMTVVADIAHRMRTNGLWSDDSVRSDHWFKDDKLRLAFWMDCCVADGQVYISGTKKGEFVYSALPRAHE
jgi:hypothetical protein